MAAEPRGRTAPSPPPPFSKHTDDTFVGAYPWNAPRSAIGRDRPLTRGEFRQVQGVLGKVNRLPYVLKTLFNSRYDFIRRNKSPFMVSISSRTLSRKGWGRVLSGSIS